MPGQYVVKAVRINSLKCSFFRVARWLAFTNFIAEKKNSQQYVVLYTEINYTLIWKWSNLAWNSSNSLVLPLSDRQMPLREKHSDIGKMTECF